MEPEEIQGVTMCRHFYRKGTIPNFYIFPGG